MIEYLLFQHFQDIMDITDGMADDSSIRIENSSGNLVEQVIVPCIV